MKDYYLLTRDINEEYLRNYETGRLTKIKEEDLPEGYFKCFYYRYWYYYLKCIKDIAYHRPIFENHINKDARIYLSYNKRLEKNIDEEPIKYEEWDCSTWRVPLVEFVEGVEKYSPYLNLDKIKAQINLTYDQCINHNKGLIGFNFTYRPYPFIKTPHFISKIDNICSEYEIIYEKGILTEVIDKEFAIKYVKQYIKKVLSGNKYEIIKKDGDIIFKVNNDNEDVIVIRKIEE